MTVCVDRIVVLSDLHLPFEDKGAVALALRIVNEWQPGRVILAGDMLDFYAVSAHDRNPQTLKDGGLQEELDAWRSFAVRLRTAAPTECAVNFLPGNHEDRLRRYLWRNPELHGLRALDLPGLMDLERLGIAYAEHDIELAKGRLVVQHGTRVRAFSGMSARAELERLRYAQSSISGHTHRLSAVYTRVGDRVVGAWENGCLCTLDPDWTHRPDWQHGCTLVRVCGDEFAVTTVPFLGSGKKMHAWLDGAEIRL